MQVGKYVRFDSHHIVFLLNRWFSLVCRCAVIDKWMLCVLLLRSANPHIHFHLWFLAVFGLICFSELDAFNSCFFGHFVVILLLLQNLLWFYDFTFYRFSDLFHHFLGSLISWIFVRDQWAHFWFAVHVLYGRGPRLKLLIWARTSYLIIETTRYLLPFVWHLASQSRILSGFQCAHCRIIIQTISISWFIWCSISFRPKQPWRVQVWRCRFSRLI